MGTLLEKRAAVIQRHKAQEEFDPHWKSEAVAGKKLSERPIAFLCDDEVVVVGDCVVKVVESLKKFVSAPDELRATREPTYAQALSKSKKILDAGVPSGGELRLHQQHWNGVALALAQVGQEVVLTDGTTQDEQPAASAASSKP